MRITVSLASVVSGLALVVAMTGAGPAPSVITLVFDAFEIDGNAVSDGKDDWKTLYDGGGSAFAYTGVICDYAFDPSPTNCGDGHDCDCPALGDDDVFTGGGSKDLSDIDQWKASFKNNPPKDEIDDAYAAFYTDTNGDLIAVFGADRLSTDGDAQIGFWFLQNDIQIDHGTGKFTGGKHANNDTLILANFTKGGGVATPKVYKWMGTNNLVDVTASADAFADVNDHAVAAPWTYVHHHDGLGGFPQGAFFEGRVNLTKALGQTLCFTTFLAETRSSSELTAVLKDLVIGNIDVCSIRVDKTCTCKGFNEDFTAFEIDFTATVTNDGAGTFPAGSKLIVTDDAGTPGNTADDVVKEQTLANSLSPGGTVVVTGSFESGSNPPHNTVTARIENSSAVTSAEAFDVDCAPCPLNPDLKLEKSCDIKLESKAGCGLVVRVDFEGSVENTGDVPLFVTVTDSEAGTVLPLTLIFPLQKVNIEGFYYPDAADGGVTDPCEAMFHDTFTATGTSPLLEDDVVEMITANCPLCPACD
jgi:hypothetical protein